MILSMFLFIPSAHALEEKYVKGDDENEDKKRRKQQMKIKIQNFLLVTAPAARYNERRRLCAVFSLKEKGAYI